MKFKRFATAILAVLFAGLLAFGFAACDPTPAPHECAHVCVTCGKCTDATCTDPVCAEKCPGHDNPPPTHVCGHVCPTCGKCTDTACTDPVCAEKCEGHRELVNLKEFARKWYGKDNIVLDLKAQTLTGESDFEVTAMTGEKAKTVISCTYGGKNYELSLHKDGYLALYEVAAAATDDAPAEGETAPEPAAVFYADISKYAGAWLNNDKGIGVYYFFNAAPDKDAQFSMYTVSLFQGYEPEYNYPTAITSTFSFTEEGEVTIGLTDEYGFFRVYEEDGKYMIDDQNLYYRGEVWELSPLDFFGGKTFSDDSYVSYGYDATVNYITKDNNIVLFDFENHSVEYDTRKVTYECKATELGAGYAFTAGNKNYLLQLQLLPADQAGLLPIGVVTEEGAVGMVQYDPLALLGTWMNGDGSVSFTMGNDGKIAFNDGTVTKNIVPEPSYSDGGVVFTFERSNRTYHIRSIANVDAAISMECDYTPHAGYYILDTARQYFFDTFTTNIETVTVEEDQTITRRDMLEENEPFTTKGVFDYIPELECIAFTYSDNYGSHFLLLAAEGILWGTESDEQGNVYLSESMLNAEALKEVQDMLTAGLKSNADYYVTGVNGHTISFDFTKPQGLTIDGVDYFFTWNVTETLSGNLEISALYVATDGEKISKAGTVEANGKGLTQTEFEVKNGEIGDGYDYIYYVSKEELEENLGRSFVLQGFLFDEKMILNPDGTFELDTTDSTDSDHAVTLATYNYDLLSWDLNDGHAFIVGFYMNDGSDLALYVYMYEKHARLFDILYTDTRYTDYTGTYYAADGATVTLSAKGEVGYLAGGAMATPNTVHEKSATLTENDYTVTFTLNMSEAVNTVVFRKDGTATLTLATATQGTALVKGKFDPFPFLGTYTVGEGSNAATITFSLSTAGVNFTPTLQAELKDALITSLTTTYTTDGKLVATVSAFLTTTYYIFTYDGTNLTVAIQTTKDGVTSTTDPVTVTSFGLNDYSRFAFEGEKTITDNDGGEHKIKALLKEGGKAVLYFCDGREYTISKIEIKSATEAVLTLTYAEDTVLVTLTVGEEGDAVSVGYPTPVGPPIPPPPPPPPPAPPAPPAPEL